MRPTRKLVTKYGCGVQIGNRDLRALVELQAEVSTVESGVVASRGSPGRSLDAAGKMKSARRSKVACHGSRAMVSDRENCDEAVSDSCDMTNMQVYFSGYSR